MQMESDQKRVHVERKINQTRDQLSGTASTLIVYETAFLYAKSENQSRNAASVYLSNGSHIIIDEAPPELDPIELEPEGPGLVPDYPYEPKTGKLAAYPKPAEYLLMIQEPPEEADREEPFIFGRQAEPILHDRELSPPKSDVKLAIL